jgi:hypothetical protein
MAAASTRGDHNTTWVHVYLVWDWLAVYTTISNKGQLAACDYSVSSARALREGALPRLLVLTVLSLPVCGSSYSKWSARDGMGNKSQELIANPQIGRRRNKGPFSEVHLLLG